MPTANPPDAADKVRIEYGEGVINWRGVKMVNPGGSLALRAAISRKRFAPVANGRCRRKIELDGESSVRDENRINS